MKKAVFVLLFVIILFGIVACFAHKTVDSDNLPGLSISFEQFNQEMRLYAPQEANTFKIKDNLHLVLENLTDVPILFSENQDLKIYIKEGNNWNLITNDLHNLPEEQTVLPKGQQPFGGLLVVLHPSISANNPATIRIIIIGRKAKNQSEVGAYVDVTLKPGDL